MSREQRNAYAAYYNNQANRRTPPRRRSDRRARRSNPAPTPPRQLHQTAINAYDIINRALANGPVHSNVWQRSVNGQSARDQVQSSSAIPTYQPPDTFLESDLNNTVAVESGRREAEAVLPVDTLSPPGTAAQQPGQGPSQSAIDEAQRAFPVQAHTWPRFSPNPRQSGRTLPKPVHRGPCTKRDHILSHEDDHEHLRCVDW